MWWTRARRPARRDAGRRVVGPVEVALLAVEAVLAVAEVGEAERVGQQLLLDVARRRRRRARPRCRGSRARPAPRGARRAAAGCRRRRRRARTAGRRSPRSAARCRVALGWRSRWRASRSAQKSSAASDATPSWIVWIVAERRAARRRAGELEPGEDRAGRALLVAEVEVVGLGLVEVDGLLDQPQPEHVGVELDVLLRVARDHRDVVEPFELHDALLGVDRGHASRSSCACNYF